MIPPPELHLLIGTVNKMFDELSKVWPDCEDMWMKALHINDSRKLLKNVKILEDSCPPHLRGYADAFNAFNEVVTSCYGTVLQQN